MIKGYKLKLDNKTRKISSGALWAYIETISRQLVSFIVSVILARLIAPEKYGTVALVMIFISIADVLVTSGLGSSLIQKFEPDDADYSTALITGFGVSLLLYVFLSLTASWIAGFYGDHELILVFRILSVRIIISSVISIQNAYIVKQLQFRISFISSFVATLGSGIVGIIMAYQGLGIWALVAQQLMSAALNCILLGVMIRRKLALVFSYKKLKPLFSYGWKITFTSVTDVLYARLSGLFIGTIFSMTDLAYYNRGEQLPLLIVDNVNTAITRVLQPVLAEVQTDLLSIKRKAKRAIKTSAFIMSPLLVGLAICAEPVIVLLLTDKWLGSVIYVQLTCIVFLFMPINSINQLVMNAMGRSDIFLKIGVAKKILGLMVLTASIIIFDGPISIMLASLFSMPITVVLNAFPNKKLIDYGLPEQLRDLLPSFMLSMSMGIVVKIVGVLSLPLGYVWHLVIQISAGALIYVVSAKVLKREEYFYVIKMIRGAFSRKTQ